MNWNTEDDRIVHLGLTQSDIQQHLLESGLWTRLPEEGFENTHFVLSPCAYKISHTQQSYLHYMATRTFAALTRVNDRLCACAAEVPKNNVDARFLKLAHTATRGLALPCAGMTVPPVLKVDLVCHQNGQYQIAEVDAYNPRGFGYLALLDGTLPDTPQNRFPGIGQLASLLKAAETVPNAQWYIIVSEFERYYEPTFSILVPALAKRGVRVRTIRERELSLREIPKDMHALIIPESLDRYPELRKRLLDAYRRGELTLLYPPAAYLGSKAFLPFLAKEKKMGRYIPRCGLVSRYEDPLPSMRSEPVLKGVSSSGMKQVVLADIEPQRFLHVFRDARAKKFPRWVMQEQIPQKPFSVIVFGKGGREEVRSYFFRLTAYITKDGVLGAEVTGRPDKMVHGAPDCIQIPCVLA